MWYPQIGKGPLLNGFSQRAINPHSMAGKLTTREIDSVKGVLTSTFDRSRDLVPDLSRCSPTPHKQLHAPSCQEMGTSLERPSKCNRGFADFTNGIESFTCLGLEWAFLASIVMLVPTPCHPKYTVFAGVTDLSQAEESILLIFLIGFRILTKHCHPRGMIAQNRR
jgi:hypothetical protein